MPKIGRFVVYSHFVFYTKSKCQGVGAAESMQNVSGEKSRRSCAVTISAAKSAETVGGCGASGARGLSKEGRGVSCAVPAGRSAVL